MLPCNPTLPVGYGNAFTIQSTMMDSQGMKYLVEGNDSLKYSAS